jgi:DNA-directed RNA polymerase subunit RPC12/RpoP
VNEQTEYRCRKCGQFLFASDAEYGRVRIICRNRPNSRPCGEAQTVFLGGRRTVARQPVPAGERRAAVLVGAAG